MEFLQGATVAITGGTGSFGSQFLTSLLTTDVSKIIVFSRDETKQEIQRLHFNDNRIKHYLGDIRDYESITKALVNVDYVFHAAALKQVPSCEFNPYEAVKTNIIGSQNVINASICNGVKKVVMLSTDKAVLPVNAMGISKSLMEKLTISNAFNNSKTIFSITRYGNVMGSRGSVIPLFVDKLLNNKVLEVTDLNMTRFMMSLQDSVDLVLHALMNASQGDLFVQKAPAASLSTLVHSLEYIFNKKAKIKVIGPRHAEKMHEVLLSSEESARATENNLFYRVMPDTRSLDYSNNKHVLCQSFEFNSENTYQLDYKELSEILIKLNFINKFL